MINKHITIGISLAMLLACSAMAFGQTPTSPTPQRKHKVATVKVSRLNASDKLLRKAGNEIGQSMRLMKAALPIYGSRREAAMKDAQMAAQEIATGLNMGAKKDQTAVQNATAKPKPAVRKAAKARARKKVGSANTTQYSPEQVAESNRKMAMARRLLVGAQTDLTTASNGYGGHRTKAIDRTMDAINAIATALDRAGARKQ